MALAEVASPGVRILAVRGGPREQRRLLLARLPHPPSDPVGRVATALRAAALDSDTPGTESPCRAHRQAAGPVRAGRDR
ncbi:hypothetical protein ACIQB5_28110 [Streptomyces sp. NPDC088560]|uniref:hypothetical protein n=1 Tax=Streptomyces sp. NPDC088560 TaxID=3365868 RepID=UPI0037FA2B76